MDMTPMVDIAFLLLTFFMLTTAFRLPHALEIRLPSVSAHEGESVVADDIMTLYVLKESRVFVRSGLDNPVREERDRIEEKILDHLNRRWTGQPADFRAVILVKMHKDASYEDLVLSLDAIETATDRFNLSAGLVSNPVNARFTVLTMTEGESERFK
jgi:biopolymer transport protein ExbD